MPVVQTPADMDVISALLTTSGLLLAVLVGITALRGATKRILDPPFSPRLAGTLVVFVQVLLALGALSAWSRMYTGGSARPVAEWPGAVALLVGIAVQPLFALYLLLAMRVKR